MDKWDLLKEWLEEEVVQYYKIASQKNGVDQLTTSFFASGMDKVLIKMDQLEEAIPCDVEGINYMNDQKT